MKATTTTTTTIQNEPYLLKQRPGQSRRPSYAHVHGAASAATTMSKSMTMLMIIVAAIQVLLPPRLVSTTITAVNAFHHPISSSSPSSLSSRRCTRTSTRRETTTTRTAMLLHLSSNSNTNSNTNGRPDLVDQTVFIAAVQRVEAEIAMAMAQQEQEGGDSSGAAAPEQQQQQSKNDDNRVYAIGRIFVDLPVDTQPELDLTESIGPMVLVTGVWGRTADISGLQALDTITQVTVGSSAAALTATGGSQGIADPQKLVSKDVTFAASCKQSTLEATAAVLTAAAQHALQNGKTTVQLEVNRLIQGYYAAPAPPAPPASL